MEAVKSKSHGMCVLKTLARNAWLTPRRNGNDYSSYNIGSHFCPDACGGIFLFAIQVALHRVQTGLQFLAGYAFRCFHLANCFPILS